MNKEVDKIEIDSLRVGTIVNLVMAVAGWLAYYFSNSEALLLDGNFSFITTITTLTAMFIVRKKHQRTDLFPYGRYFYESFFVLFKGLLILGLTVAALFQNVIKIFDYYAGQPINALEPGIIMYYSLVMTFLCLGLAFYYKKQNQKVENGSSLLSVESKSTKIDGYLSLIVGLALILTTVVPEGSKFSFLLYIGDAIIVILLSLFLLNIPLGIVKEGFIELGGGTLQDRKSKEWIEKQIQDLLPEKYAATSSYVSKMGSSYLVIIYLQSQDAIIELSKIQAYKSKLKEVLEKDFGNLELEVVLD